MIEIYLVGHDFEYEVRNVYRIFDLNTEIDIKYSDIIDFSHNNLIVYSRLENDDKYSCETKLYMGARLLDSIILDKNSIQIEKSDDKKLRKTIVKKSMYRLLSSYFNIKAEYGFLTGIRPNKILSIALKYGMSYNEANDILAKTYEVSQEKIELLNSIYKKQERYMDDASNKENYNLYIGIPFCPSRCIYCSFVSFPSKDSALLDLYVNTLVYEIENTIKAAINAKLKLNTIYIGGGTPSVLSIENIDRIFNVISKYYKLEEVNEITFEAGRPDTITRDKLECLKRNFVSRISINPQTMNDKTLELIARRHTVNDIGNVYLMAKELSFNSINMDLIIGLPGENTEDVQKSIEEVIKLKPDNITIHALAYKKGSKLINTSKSLTKDYELVEKMYEITKTACISSGYNPYYMYRQKNIKANLENIGYALDDKESIYNIVIIEEIETILACGAGAVSKILKGNNRHERVQNYKDLKEYFENVQKNINSKIEILMS